MNSHSKCRDARVRKIGVLAEAAGYALIALPRYILGALDRRIGALLHWQRVGHDIRRLSCFSDAELKRLGLERSEVVAWVYEAARRKRERRY